MDSQKNTKSQLFQDDSPSHQNTTPSFSINQQFANYYQKSKSKQFLQEAKDKYGKLHSLSQSSDSESSEDEVGDLVTPAVQNKFISTINYISSSELTQQVPPPTFEDKDFEAKNIPHKKNKPLYLKDLIRKDIQHKMQENDSDSENQNYESNSPKNEVPFAQKQIQLKNRFLQAVKAQDSAVLNKNKNNSQPEEKSEGGIFTQIKKTQEQKQKEENEFQNFLQEEKNKSINIGTDIDVLKRFWEGDGKELSKSDKFLRYYILSEGWKPNKTNLSSFQIQQQKEDEEDYENDSNVDKYEEKCNFKYEDGTGKFIPNVSREVENTYREKTSTRQKNRKEKKERKKREKEEKLEEINRIKQIQKQELQDKLNQLKKVAGLNSLNIDEDQLNQILIEEGAEENLIDKIFNVQTSNKDHNLQEAPNKELDDILLHGDLKNLSKLENQNISTTNLETSEQPIPEDDIIWWFCDNCQNPIKPGKLRYDCTLCENFSLCQRCFKSYGHPHKIKKVKVPLECNPPSDYEKEIETALFICSNCKQNLFSTKAFFCEECRFYLCIKCKKEDEHPHELKRVKPKNEEESTDKNLKKKEWKSMTEEEKENKINEMISEKYDYQYQDFAGKVPTTFRYIPTSNSTEQIANLTNEEIMLLQNKELNSIVSLKKLAPYKTKTKSVNKNNIEKKRKQFKKVLKERKKEIEKCIASNEEIDETKKKEKLRQLKNLKKRRHKSLNNPKEQEVKFGSHQIKQKRLESYGLNV